MKRIASVLVGAWLALGAAAAHAELVAIDILSQQSFAEGKRFGDAGAYEILRARAHYAIDPADPRNARIADIALAPRDSGGRIAVAADLVMLRPVDPSKGGRLVYEVTNRGNLGLLSTLNDAPPTNDPKSAADAGNGFLLERGDAILWSGWNWDVEPTRGQVTIRLPRARAEGAAVTGPVAHEIIVSEPGNEAAISPGTLGYPLADGAADSARLSVRERPNDPRRALPRAAWKLQTNNAGAPKTVTLESGFVPGMIYELAYEARDPVIVGLGLVAIRDLLEALRDGAAPAAMLGRPARIMVFGNSQSARVVNTMLALDLERGRDGRPVFDAAFLFAGGAGKGGFNARFAQTTRHFSQFEEQIYPTDMPPFDAATLLGPGEGPKLIIAGGSTDYWTRAFSLVSTTLDGTRDLALDPRVRLFLLAGAPHGAGQAGPLRRGLELCNNPLDMRPALRALYAALWAWVEHGEAPPDSRHPRLGDGSLVDLAAYRAAFPAWPGAPSPPGKLEPPLLDFGPRFEGEGIATQNPPRVTGRLPTFVPAPDADGTDRAGLRLPALEAPLGTYTGWNPRDAASGLAGKAIGRWAGAFLPLAPDEASRKAAGDPRPSIAERYASRAEYQAQYRRAAERLVAERLLLPADVEPMTARALAFHDRLAGREPAQDAACAFLASP